MQHFADHGGDALEVIMSQQAPQEKSDSHNLRRHITYLLHSAVTFIALHLGLIWGEIYMLIPRYAAGSGMRVIGQPRYSQFFQMHPDTPQKRLLRQAAHLLAQGGLAILPSQTGYVIACDPRQPKGLQQLMQYTRPMHPDDKVLLCSDVSQVSHYALVHNAAFRFLKQTTPHAFSFVLKAKKDIPKRYHYYKKGCVAIRIPQCTVLLALLHECQTGLLSVCLPHDAHAPEGCQDPDVFRQRWEHQVALIMATTVQFTQLTTIIDFTQNEPSVQRLGIADPSPFIST